MCGARVIRGQAMSTCDALVTCEACCCCAEHCECGTAALRAVATEQAEKAEAALRELIAAAKAVWECYKLEPAPWNDTAPLCRLRAAIAAWEKA